ncbi:CRISPR-associated endonuclease Cas1 [Brevibacillus laterosporus]|nr:CRISPR-associated endonuclease Cas1 [Brevibacillus laterosporus]
MSIRLNQLVVKQEEEVTIPLEDIASIVVEENQVVLTAALLSKCSEYGIGLYTCDEKHLPNGVLLPFQSHSRQLRVLETQYNLSKPFKKRVWQKIIKTKIMNQALCLSYLDKTGESELLAIRNTVDSGDSTNREAYAAKVYFQHLFGKRFIRREDHIINHSLNYGYSILRGNVARVLVQYGFFPCLGIDHHNENNAFNLADDFMEVFRPLVDLFVVIHFHEEMEFTPKWRAGLYNVVNHQVELEGERYSCNRAIEEMIKSYVTACRTNMYERLSTPTLLPLKIHSYE